MGHTVNCWFRESGLTDVEILAEVAVRGLKPSVSASTGD
jgi:hypothetical protein